MDRRLGAVLQHALAHLDPDLPGKIAVDPQNAVGDLGLARLELLIGLDEVSLEGRPADDDVLAEGPTKVT